MNSEQMPDAHLRARKAWLHRHQCKEAHARQAAEIEKLSAVVAKGAGVDLADLEALSSDEVSTMRWAQFHMNHCPATDQGTPRTTSELLEMAELTLRIYGLDVDDLVRLLEISPSIVKVSEDPETWTVPHDPGARDGWASQVNNADNADDAPRVGMIVKEPR